MFLSNICLTQIGYICLFIYHVQVYFFRILWLNCFCLEFISECWNWKVLSLSSCFNWTMLFPESVYEEHSHPSISKKPLVAWWLKIILAGICLWLYYNHNLWPFFNFILCRLAGNARILDSSSSCGSEFLCTHLEGQLGWCCSLSIDWLLLIARTHSSIWRIQKFIHSKPRYIQHCRHCSSVGVSCLGVGAPLGCLKVMNYTCCATGTSTFY